MPEREAPKGLPEAYDADNLERMRRVPDALDREFHQIRERHYQRERAGRVP